MTAQCNRGEGTGQDHTKAEKIKYPGGPRDPTARRHNNLRLLRQDCVPKGPFSVLPLRVHTHSGIGSGVIRSLIHETLKLQRGKQLPGNVWEEEITLPGPARDSHYPGPCQQHIPGLSVRGGGAFHRNGTIPAEDRPSHPGL